MGNLQTVPGEVWWIYAKELLDVETCVTLSEVCHDAYTFVHNTKVGGKAFHVTYATWLVVRKVWPKLSFATVVDFSDVTDVSALAGVKGLTLDVCPNITDVSALGSVEELNLLRCHSITDVSALGGVKRLWIGWCHSITDVSSLGCGSVEGLRISAELRQIGRAHV